jgi:hypothetical protein
MLSGQPKPMRPNLVAFVIGSLLTLHAAGAEEALSDPPELQARRVEYLRAVQKASIPLLASYQKSLQAMKEQFTRQGNLEAALSVDRELKSVTADLEAANSTAQGNLHSVPLPIIVISAIYLGPEPQQKVDGTKRIQQALSDGKPAITVREAVGGADPAPYKRKMLTVEYSINGKVKKKMYGEGDTINFRQDLK